MRTRRSQSSSDPVQSVHRSVLLGEAVDALDIEPNDTILDATLGGAGHASEITKRLDAAGVFIGFDLDHAAIERAERALEAVKCKQVLIEANFRDLEQELAAREIASIDGALFDLGWSSYQLGVGRGFSFQSDEPLLMTYQSTPTGITASEIVNEWSEDSIADVLFGWGQERFSRRIARAIIEHRQTGRIETAKQLAQIVFDSVPSVYRHGRNHPATKTFQALRIAVNDELGALEVGAKTAFSMLSQEGVLAIITFHSIEDGIVKRLFTAWEHEGKGRREPKKFIAPSEAELHENPRARSAKLRAIRKGVNNV